MGSALFAATALAQNTVFSTHDWTLSIGGPEPTVFDETWADVKMPGGFPTTAAGFPVPFPQTVDNRNTYAVGTIEVNFTAGGVFSNNGATTGGGALTFGSLGVGVTRQVAMLQFNDAANVNFIQRYFYGTTPTDPLRATNARGVSGWRGATPADDRIAICGETYDQALPLSQAAVGWAAANVARCSGFIAVFDGNGALLWTHHFFDPGNPGTESCAITDVSIRVDARMQDLAFDAVRTEFDLVPQGAFGVGRTDGTGFQAGVVGLFPPAVASGFTGGTTPFCALAPFGIQIGQPLPGLSRMLIDFEGALAPGSTNAAIVISRPTAQVGAIAAGVLQFGFPPAAPFAYITGTEFWLGGGVFTTFPALGPNQAFRMQLFPLPVGGGLVSAQLVCLLAAPVNGPAPGCASGWSASPALWFGW